jgi:S-DNA-T family DNA segregation ATPase FtsK/SpoIIIE
MPHLLIAGTTGSGKSVCLNTMIISLLYNAAPEEVKLLMIDPKQVEFTIYGGIPHLIVPVVSDPRKAAGALGWAVNEMLRRYKLFSEKNVRDLTGYNKLIDSLPPPSDGGEAPERMPQIVIFIDELSDLMMAAPNEVEDSICRLAQMARAAGMHLVIATQRPSVDVITGIIKANIPSRVSLSVSSQIDSRTIIDMSGAEKLLGNGDMLFNPVGNAKPTRVQGCYVSEEEVERVVRFVKEQSGAASYDDEVLAEIDQNAASVQGPKKRGGGPELGGLAPAGTDELFAQAMEVAVEAGMVSTTMLQKRLKLGYARASRMMDELYDRGVIGPFEGAKPRKVLITRQQMLEMMAGGNTADNETT